MKSPNQLKHFFHEVLAAWGNAEQPIPGPETNVQTSSTASGAGIPARRGGRPYRPAGTHASSLDDWEYGYTL